MESSLIRIIDSCKRTKATDFCQIFHKKAASTVASYWALAGRWLALRWPVCRVFGVHGPHLLCLTAYCHSTGAVERLGPRSSPGGPPNPNKKSNSNTNPRKYTLDKPKSNQIAARQFHLHKIKFKLAPSQFHLQIKSSNFVKSVSAGSEFDGNQKVGCL
jgi:hypothetical protein